MHTFVVSLRRPRAARALLALAGLLAAAGCVTDSAQEVEKLFLQTHDLNDRLVVLEDQCKELNQRHERLQSLFNDLSVRLKDVQLEIRLLRTRSEPYASAEEALESEEKALDLVKRIGTANDQEWPKMKEELLALGHVAVPFLLEASSNQGPAALMRANEALRGIRDPRALSAFLAALEHPRTRLIAVEALGTLGVKKAVPDLARHLGDERAHVRLAVAESLGNLGDLSGVPVLLERLEDPSSPVRHLAVSTLRRLTSQNFEYDPDSTEDERKAAIDQWRKWWQVAKRNLELAVDLEKAGASDLPGGEDGQEPDKPGDGE